MKARIGEWGKALETAAAALRGEKRFKDAMKPNEYINVIGHDSSILEVVLELGRPPYAINVYTRVVWSAEHPQEAPFLFKRYIYEPDLEKRPQADREKPKQAFYDDKVFKPEYLTEHAVEEVFELRALLGEAAEASRRMSVGALASEFARSPGDLLPIPIPDEVLPNLSWPPPQK